MPTKLVLLEQLRLGMYVARLDVSWIRSPFLRHSFLIRKQAQIDRLRRAGVQAVEIDPHRGLDVDDLPGQIHQEAGGGPAVGQAATPLAALAPHTRLARLAEEYAHAKIARQQLEQAVQSVYSSIAEQGTIDSRLAEEAVQEIRIAARTVSNSALFMALSQYRSGDAQLSRHALATCTLALILGQSYGFDPRQLNELGTAALLHDVGLMEIAPPILARCASTSFLLTERERRQFQSHPRLTVRILERDAGFEASMLHLINEHHALLDGTGYPPETRGEFTSARTRMLVIADRYDEMIIGFGGATPLAPHQALQRLYREAQEGRLDRDIVSRLIKSVGIYPVHSCVKLNTREVAVVADLNPARLHRPVVIITHEPDGSSCPTPRMVDLAHQEGTDRERRIDSVLDLDACSVEPAHVTDQATPPLGLAYS
ncbi:MAG TPA: DUF3391 domain-containing protein [Nitrospira sp.]|nr:DUF3391 domain-containing protein [Nitrospira sp.]